MKALWKWVLEYIIRNKLIDGKRSALVVIAMLVFNVAAMVGWIDAVPTEEQVVEVIAEGQDVVTEAQHLVKEGEEFARSLKLMLGINASLIALGMAAIRDTRTIRDTVILDVNVDGSA